MRYSNDDPRAVIAMELERTGGYGDYSDYGDFCDYDGETVCPVCGAVDPEHFYMNDDEECVGCYECLHRVYDLF